jgi:hypothetical protein
MRRIVQLFVAAFVLFGSAFVLAGTATAAPAQPYNYSDCVGDAGGYQFCETGQSVLKDNQSASGNTLYTASGQFSYVYSFNGQTIYQSSTKYHSLSVTRDANTQVDHYNNKGQFSVGNTTCTFTDIFTYANGEVRHETHDFQCTP